MYPTKYNKKPSSSYVILFFIVLTNINKVEIQKDMESMFLIVFNMYCDSHIKLTRSIFPSQMRMSI